MSVRELPMRLRAGTVDLDGELAVPDLVRGAVVFAHGAGSRRGSPRNRRVATALHGRGFATLLFDLLTPDERADDDRTARLRFDIGLLGGRLVEVVTWLRRSYAVAARPVGLYGGSTGAAGALVAAARLPGDVAAVVSRGGRPDLAGDDLARVRAPTLLIVGGRDAEVRALNERAAERLGGPSHLEVVSGAGHLFAEPGALDAVCGLAGEWFGRHLAGNGPRTPHGPA
ncbi:MAG TPA: alpha/beta family hydrolase [Streptosporangiaceae bacterium]